MLTLLLETSRNYPSQWVALDRRMQVIDHGAELASLRERLRERGRACTFMFFPAEPLQDISFLRLVPERSTGMDRFLNGAAGRAKTASSFTRKSIPISAI